MPTLGLRAPPEGTEVAAPSGGGSARRHLRHAGDRRTRTTEAPAATERRGGVLRYTERSAAVKANIERGQTVEGSAIISDLSEITSIETPDDRTVVLTLSTPNTMLPGMLSHRAGAMVSPTAFDNPDLDRMPVGAGPYRSSSTPRAAASSWSASRSTGTPRPAVPTASSSRSCPTPGRGANALLAGEIDMTVLTGNEAPEVRRFATEGEPALTYLVLTSTGRSRSSATASCARR